MNANLWNWRAVLFDLDGTLADTVPLILASYRHTLRTVRGHVLPDRLWLDTVGRPLRDAFGEFARDADELRAMQDAYVAYQRTVHDEMVRPMPGAVEVVHELAEAGVALALVTSKRREMAERTLAVCGLGGSFAVTVTADDVERGKPDPEPVRRTLDALGRGGAERPDPSRCLFVGDSPFDLAAGRAAGVRTVGVTTGPFGAGRLRAERPDYLVERLADLPRAPR